MEESFSSIRSSPTYVLLLVVNELGLQAAVPEETLISLTLKREKTEMSLDPEQQSSNVNGFYNSHVPRWAACCPSTQTGAGECGSVHSHKRSGTGPTEDGHGAKTGTKPLRQPIDIEREWGRVSILRDSWLCESHFLQNSPITWASVKARVLRERGKTL